MDWFMGGTESIFFLLSIIVVLYFILEVALVQSSVHDKVLGSVVGEHNCESAQIGLEGVKLQECQEVVGDGEEDYSDDDEVKGRSARYLVAGQAGDRFCC